MIGGRILTCLLAVGALITGAHMAFEKAGAEEAEGAVSESLVAGDAGPFVVYMDPSGSNRDAGRTRETAVRTLGRVQEILEAEDPGTDVEVRILPGVYRDGQTRWSYYVSGHRISFMPVDYGFGDTLDDIEARPRFDGGDTDGWWFSGTLPDEHKGGRTQLGFYYLEVSGYSQGGITLNGGTETRANERAPVTDGMNGNTIYGMRFVNLGNKYAGESPGYGAIDLVNSRYNLIASNEFTDIENSTNPGNIHGVYLAHHSSGNIVYDNTFDTISGDPMRVRDDSNDNEIYNNTFTRAGKYAYSEWFCDSAAECSRGVECASHGNVFRDNRLVSDYRGEPLPARLLTPGDQSYAGQDWSCGNEDEARVTDKSALLESIPEQLLGDLPFLGEAKDDHGKSDG